MLIHPWDAATRRRRVAGLAGTDRFGMLVANNLDPVDHRERVVDQLRQRDHSLDAGAAAQQLG
jgi:hypothetical protein